MIVLDLLKKCRSDSQLIFNIKLYKKQLGSADLSLSQEEKFRKYIHYLRHLAASMEREPLEPLYPKLSIGEDLSLSGFDDGFKRYDIAGFEPSEFLRLKVNDRFIEKYGEYATLGQILYESVFYGFDEKFFPDREWYRYETFYDLNNKDEKIVHLSPIRNDQK